MKKGLDKEKIITTSLKMIEQDGRANFSLHKLAAALGVKTASLYNYVYNFEELMTAISLDVIQQLIRAEEKAIAGKRGDAAIAALARAYFHFGREHYELYQIFMESRQPRSDVLEKAGIHILDPILTAFAEIQLSPSDKIHWERIFRSLIHGFIAQEEAGFFTYGHINSQESFEKSIQCFLTGIHAAESRASK